MTSSATTQLEIPAGVSDRPFAPAAGPRTKDNVRSTFLSSGRKNVLRTFILCRENVRSTFFAGNVLIPFLAVGVGGAQARGAGGVAGEKHRYTLFDPTPPRLMREMSADRPDVTESPYTVDAGHVQLEMSFLDVVLDDDGPWRTRTYTVAPLNLKLGLLNNVDLQLAVDPYVYTRLDNGERDSSGGVGDSQLRLKINLWGNDEGQTAFAMMPFVKLPIGADEITNDHVEAGLIFPFQAELPAGFSLGLMAELDVIWDEQEDDYDLEFLHTVALGRDIAGSLAGYVEYIGIAPSDSSRPYQALIGTGVSYLLNRNAQLDAGVIFGLTEASDDYNLFVGLTLRI